MRAAFLIFFIASFSFSGMHGQGTLSGFSVEPDTVPDIDADIEYVPQKQKSHLFKGKPGKAALYSLVIPGAGQVYNGKIWKVPLIYAALGATGYFVIDNSNEYFELRDGYVERLKALEENRTPSDIYVNHPRYGFLSPESIRIYRNEFNRYRQISIFIFALTWIANSAEAFVDAHLSDFDVNDDLSLRLFVPPSQEPPRGTMIQASLCYRF